MPPMDSHLREVAAAYLRRESEDHMLQPTALVHELNLRLLQQRKPDWEDRAHFHAFAGSVMRRILTDHARATHAISEELASSMCPVGGGAAGQFEQRI
jgi:hypothetical protein